MTHSSITEKVSALRIRLRSITPPEGLRCKSFYDRRVASDFAFFPGGQGLTDAQRCERITTIILGSDWGNETSFARIVARHRYIDESSFRYGKALLLDAGFRLEECFFTNAWPVLRSDDMPESKPHAMRDVPGFTAACRDFFGETIKSLQPRVVITLGKSPAWFVAPYVGKAWPAGAFESANDEAFKLKHLGVEYVRSDRNDIVYVPATHWSYPTNGAKRGFASLDYRTEEVELYRRARKTSGIS